MHLLLPAPATPQGRADAMTAHGRHPRREPWSAGLPASVLLHLPLIAALALLPGARMAAPPPIAGIVVELVSPRQYEAAAPVEAPTPPEGADEAPAAPAPAPASAPEPQAATAPPDVAPVPSPAAAPPAASGMVRATAMLSGAALADPRSREARAALAGMDGDERLIQLCNVEAMSQLHAWRADLDPDQVVAYATADLAVAGGTVSAEGAAFRDHGRWFRMTYRCEAAADPPAVAAFEFAVGEAIPPEAWVDYNLPGSPADAD